MCVGNLKKKASFFPPYGFDLFIYFKYSSFKDYLRASGVLGNLIPVASEFADSLMVDCFLVWLISSVGPSYLGLIRGHLPRIVSPKESSILTQGYH